MENGEIQKELFEFDDRPRKPFPQLEKMLPKADFEGKVAVTLGLDRIVFIAIGIILVMVVVFAIGVERGKSIERAEIEPIRVKTAPESTAAIDAAAQPTQPVQPSPAKPTVAATVPAQKVVQPPAVRQEIPTDIGSKPYTIVAGSFRGKDAAQSAASTLKKAGLAAYVTQNDPFFVVCVGGYSSRGAAQDTFTKVKRSFKDAYIKLR